MPELADFFPPKTPAVWKVRGLSAHEVGRAVELSTVNHQANLRAAAIALAGNGDKSAAIQRLIGLSPEDVPADVSRRIEELAAGSVSPLLGSEKRDVAVRLAENFPNIFYRLTNAIRQLTDQGSEAGKPKRSGKPAKSET